MVGGEGLQDLVEEEEGGGMMIEISHKRKLIILSAVGILAMHQALVHIHTTSIVFLDT
jgi:hypothetical protein